MTSHDDASRYLRRGVRDHMKGPKRASLTARQSPLNVYINFSRMCVQSPCNGMQERVILDSNGMIRLCPMGSYIGGAVKELVGRAAR